MLTLFMLNLQPSGLWTDALELMDNLKLLQLNFVELNGSYENFSVDLRWLCWLGFHLRTIPSDLFMGNLVAVDMSYSNLEVFDPPMVLHSLQILNLKDSHNLFEIRNIYKIPLLETLILWNCNSLVHVCETIGDLNHLTLLNMTGCHSLCKREKNNLLEASTSGKEVTIQPPFSFPQSLERLFLNDCKLECTDYLPLSFDVQPFLQYLNLSNGLFEFLPYYHHLINLRVLDLTFSSRLKWLLCLPNTLAELYVYSCKSLEKITFQSPRFTLQEFGYSGCINLAEIEGFIKLVPIAKLDESDLGHMKWLKEYQNHEVLLMLYEFDIMSTSLPDVEDSNMMPEYISESPFLFFDVPSCSNNKRIKGLNVTFRYTLSGDDGAWFAKISTDNGVDLMYNPKVYGKPDSGEVGIWVSYWPIRSAIDVGDKVNVSIVVLSGLMVRQCGASLVYADDEEEHETLEKNTGWVETLGGNLSGFQLSTGAYYLCRRDLFELMEVGRLTPHWFRILFGDTIDYTEVQGWRKTGRPKRSNPSYTELKTVRCIIHGPEQEEIYKIAEMSKSSLVDKNVDFTSSILGVGDMMKSGTISEIGSATRKEESESYNLETIGMSDSDETTESALKDESKSAVIYEVSDEASLTTVAGFIKLVPIAKLDETNLENLKWLIKDQNHDVPPVGDDELTFGRSSSHVQLRSTLDIGDTVNVSSAVMRGLEVHECGASLVYTDNKMAEVTLENNMGWVEILGGGLSGFQLSTGAYYLCRRNFFELMEVGRQIPYWFKVLVGDAMTIQEKSQSYNLETMGKYKAVVSDETTESTTILHDDKSKSVVFSYDVYLSFRSEYTRFPFINHFLEKLKQAGIHPIRAVIDSNRDGIVMSRSKGVIKESKGSIVVFSEAYATSDVRMQNKTFQIEFQTSTSTRGTYDNMYLWKAALTEVTDLSYLVYPGPDITREEFLKTVVETIRNEIDRK
ncbi:Toll/interleukin-1 receptor homology (TIR) domain-containing protein [Cynara cardunculus var. scolymus]|uniref:Toll/interleukin-1 receptor homology (TIR) domain-containing protein n=1 Tax=Cynara cardunculus var. scolymus TaxID=59895 RepID=A0A103XD26_CYNCS|nr:Toll/interleukin-1 receptor homology (TIR) domain-containing protein [Cynara cardunculus var. scolymus]